MGQSFGSVEHILETYSSSNQHKILIIDMSNVGMVDLTGIFALEDLINSLRKSNIEVYVTRSSSKIEYLLDKTGFLENIGRDNFSNDLHSIVTSILSQKT